MQDFSQSNFDYQNVAVDITKKSFFDLNPQQFLEFSSSTEQYIPVLIFAFIALGLSIVVIVIPFLLNKMRPDVEKNSQYECGFESEGEVRNEFNIKFYLVAILFIIFDLEVAFLFPWAVSLNEIGQFGYWSMMIFLIVLTIGFIYEWMRGALEWK